MHRMLSVRGCVRVLATVVMLAGAVSAYAQTDGMDRRDDRRDDRSGARADKQACKAGDEKSRPECRQEKRDSKQDGRQDGGGTNEPAAPNPAQ